MILINLKGGLGNVMFQYALGKHLSIINNTNIKYDINSYRTNPLGDYSFSLEGFKINIRDNLADEEIIKKLKKFQKKVGRRWFLYNLLIADNRKYVTTQKFQFDPQILSVDATENDIYLDGWWQTEKYFIDIRDILLKDFDVKEPLQGKNKEISDIILKNNSVSIHVRRLDYVSNPRTKSFHGELTKTYYEQAVSYINSLNSNIYLFIFSDDISWAEKNLTFKHPTKYIGWNIDKPHIDIHLMSLCKHNIITNSTLGWWGAWLNSNENKIVIGPQKWFNNAPQYSDEDVLPENWIKM